MEFDTHVHTPEKIIIKNKIREIRDRKDHTPDRFAPDITKMWCLIHILTHKQKKTEKENGHTPDRFELDITKMWCLIHMSTISRTNTQKKKQRKENGHTPDRFELDMIRGLLFFGDEPSRCEPDVALERNGSPVCRDTVFVGDCAK